MHTSRHPLFRSKSDISVASTYALFRTTCNSFTVLFTKYSGFSSFRANKMWVKVKWSRYRPGVAQRVGRGIALLFHDCDTRRGWVVSSTPRPHFTPGKDPVPILQEAGWAPGPVWTGEKSRPHRDSIPDRLARSQSPYRLSYRAHIKCESHVKCKCVSRTNMHHTQVHVKICVNVCR